MLNDAALLIIDPIFLGSVISSKHTKVEFNLFTNDMGNQKKDFEFSDISKLLIDFSFERFSPSVTYMCVVLFFLTIDVLK